MTREHKLALIVGFSLVLVLGVLISDHFSKARQQAELADGLQPAQAGEVGALPPGIQMVADNGPALQPLPGVTPSTIQPPTQPLAHTANAPESATFVYVNDPSIPRAEIPPQLDGMTQMTTSGAIGNLSGSETPAVPGAVVVLDDGRPSPMSTIAPSPAPASPRLPVSSGQLRRHEVKEGDSVYRLAQTTYGDGRLWEKVRDYNKGRVGQDGAVREGVTILLPPKDVLLGKAVLSDSPEAARPGSTPRPDSRPDRSAPSKTDTRTASASGYTTYVVQKGDMLAEVARKMLGSSTRWPEIVDANKGVIDDPDSLTIGTRIRIPSR